MRFRWNKILAIALLGILFTSGFLLASEEAEKSAISSATEWLNLVDEGRYEKSWEESASLFKIEVSRDKWLGLLKDNRFPLGKVLTRKLKLKHYTKSMPGAPDGDYVVLQYETTFEKKPSTLETITPMLDKDGKWRVMNYYITFLDE
ncbi:MAG: DUF4019 domain-containing protein [Thermodesulfobacteriota bacterium]